MENGVTLQYLAQQDIERVLVWIGHTQTRKNPPLEYFHSLGLRLGLMIITEQYAKRRAQSNGHNDV